MSLQANNENVDREVHRDLIGSMLAQGQFYAALAHVQQQQRNAGNSDELRYLEAEARRGLGQSAQADALYRQLLNSAFAAEAYHGLGLLHATTQPAQAIGYLRQAAQRRPTSADMRNDLGYALMRSGQYRDAMIELSTAVELAPESEKARNNLLMMLMLTRDEVAVRKLAADAGVSAETLAGLRRQALALRSRGGAAGGNR